MSIAAILDAANDKGSDCICPYKGIDRTSIGEYECSTCVMAMIQIRIANNLDEINIDFGAKIELSSSASITENSLPSHEFCEYLLTSESV